MEVRLATEVDAPAAIRLLTAQLAEHHLPVDPNDLARGVALALASGSRAWIVLAMRDGQPAGVALVNRIVSVEHGGESAWLEELYVVPEARRTGIARALLQFIALLAREHGLRALDLEVVRTQDAALRLYEQEGFQRVDRLRFTRAVR